MASRSLEGYKGPQLNMNVSSYTHDDGDNLVKMASFDEDSLCQALAKRYKVDSIYTYVGDIVIAVNPYRALPICSPAWEPYYRDMTVHGKLKDDLPPHCWYLSVAGYNNMTLQQKNQAFVISGESGAGKSETTKLIVRMIIALAKGAEPALEKKIMMVQPFLEAFGNAKTVMNNNSSRFGKLIGMKFTSTGTVIGCQLSQYLLEKSRIIDRNPNERNYHIFYYLFGGAIFGNDKLTGELGLTQPCLSYKYLAPKKGDTSTTEEWVKNDKDAHDDAKDMAETMPILGFTDAEIASMYKIMAGVLLCGECEFAEGGESGSELSKGDYNKIASLWGVPAEGDLTAEGGNISGGGVKSAMTKKAVEARGDLMWKSVKPQEATDNTNSMAKMIYQRCFIWLFAASNAFLCDADKLNQPGILQLGILDIFGFEDFKWNSVEQMCINTTNEQLQFFFNKFIFAKEMELYASEGVPTVDIKFEDNKPTLDMLMGKKDSLMVGLDEQCKAPKSSDEQYTQMMSKQFGGKDRKIYPGRKGPDGKSLENDFIKPKFEKDLNFKVVHYAGTVTYQTKDWLDKNKDAVTMNVTKMFQGSSDPLIVKLFSDPAITGENTAAGKGGRSKPSKPTLCKTFRKNLLELASVLNSSEPCFVRCLKPNDAKVPMEWEDEKVKRQLRYAGVMETVKIRKLGYSLRETFPGFVKRYKIIAFKISEEPDETVDSCKKICAASGLSDYQVGNTMVFLKDEADTILTAAVVKHTNALHFMQKIVKGFQARNDYKPMLEAKKKQDSVLSAFAQKFKGFSDALIAKCEKGLAQDLEEAKPPKKNRVFLQDTKAREAAEAKIKAEKEKKEKENQKKLEQLEAAAKKAGKPLGKLDNLTLKVGALGQGEWKDWSSKVDKKSGRKYYKNHALKTTQWHDPRGAKVLAADAASAEGDDLPFGWEAGTTPDGDKYYIDHVNQATHWASPKDLLAEKKENLSQQKAKAEKVIVKRRQTMKGFRDKKKRLQANKSTVGDEEAQALLDQQIAEMDNLIDKQTDLIQEENAKHKDLEEETEALAHAFKKAEYEKIHGKGTYSEEDTDDLYSTEEKGSVADDIAGTDMNTMKRNRVKAAKQKQLGAYTGTMQARGTAMGH